MDNNQPFYGVDTECKDIPWTFPPQHQDRQPGMEYEMVPLPIFDNPKYVGTGKLKDKVALITGGDSGIGRAVAVAFAKEGANLVIAYYDEEYDAQETKRVVEQYGATCHLIAGDLRNIDHCQYVIDQTIKLYGKIDILINNLGVQIRHVDFETISDEQIQLTFNVNILPFFYITKRALPHMTSGASIVNTTSVAAYIGNPDFIDYSSTKGAIVSFTRALARKTVDRGIRVNAVAPGPFWTPLQPSSFPADIIKTFGSNVPMKRAGQPYELAPVYVLLASDDGSYITGATFHVNGGMMTTT
ncbi:MAG: SDR family oxidoreductase [Sporolactobacillus sp.]